MSWTDTVILLFALLLLTSTISTKLSFHLGIPSLLPFILIGMLLNHFVYFDNAQLTQLCAIVALIIILFDGGLRTRKEQIRTIWLPATLLSSFGVLITSLITGMAAHYILGLSWLEGMLVGAIVGSTDAAAVFAAFGNTNIRRKITNTLEMESGSNDPMAVLLTLAIIQLLIVPESSWFVMLGFFIKQVLFGLLFGWLFGKITIWLIQHLRLPSSEIYPILALSLAILTYSVTALIDGSGLLAVYLMAIIVGNADIRYKSVIFRFQEGFASMMQMLMFILLGLLVFPAELLQVSWQAILLSLVLMLVARPLSVLICTWGKFFDWREKTFLAWAGLKGAVPIILATYPLLAGIESSRQIFNVVFFIVLTSALVQGTSLQWLAEKLGITEGERKQPTYRLELIAGGKSNVELVEMEVVRGSRAENCTLREITLPNETLITAIVRGDQLIPPTGDTCLKSGDVLYILLPHPRREQVQQLLESKAT